MKKILIACSLISLTACDWNDDSTTVVSISGDTEVSDTGSEMLQGQVNLSGDASFVEQTNSSNPLGKFSITADGDWQYQPERSSEGLVELIEGESTTEVISLPSDNGETYSIILNLNGQNDIPTFGTGLGIDHGEITAEIDNILIGTLTVDDPDANQSNFTEQLATQGNFGEFSISSTGEWSYKITNFATDFVAPEESFIVSSSDGTEHQVSILVKGLYQRLTLENDVEGTEVNYEPGSDAFFDNIDVTNEPLSLSSFFEKEYLTGSEIQVRLQGLYDYDESGKIKKVESYFAEEISPSYIYDYQYEYIDNKLANVSYDRLQYRSNGGSDHVLYRKVSTQYDFENNQKINESYLSYNYDDSGENPELRYSVFVDSSYNEQGRISESYKGYEVPENSDLNLAFEENRLQHQHFYHEDGRLDYTLYYRVSISYIYEGLQKERRYFYDEQNRLSYTLSYFANYEEIEDIRVYSEIDYSSPSISAYHYLDELDLVIYYTPNEEELTSLLTVDKASIYYYEDTDQCGDFSQILHKINYLSIPVCKLKTVDSSTKALPQLPL